MTDIFARNFDFEIEEETAQLEDATASSAQTTVTLTQAEMMAEQAKKAGYEEGIIAGTARALSEERSSRTARCDEALVALANNFVDLAAPGCPVACRGRVGNGRAHHRHWRAPVAGFVRRPHR